MGKTSKYTKLKKRIRKKTKRIKREIKYLRKDINKLSKKDKMKVGATSSLLIPTLLVPIPGVAPAAAALNLAYIKRLTKKNKKYKRLTKKNKKMDKKNKKYKKKTKSKKYYKK